MVTKKRNRFWQLHSVLGIALGLPLFVIFVAGTLAFLEPFAIHWLHPSYGDAPEETPALDATVARLLERLPATDEISISPASRDRPVIDAYLEQNHQGTHFWIHPRTLEITGATPHDADLFHFFVDLHYFDFIPYGKEITGLIAALFFAIILTGVVYQWRNIRKDAHPRNLSLKRPNRWKKVHRFTSLFTLPFQVLYSVTGAALALGLLLAAPAVYLFFDGKTTALNATLFPGFVITATPPDDRPPFPVDEAIAIARAHWPADVSLERLHIANLAGSEENPASRTIMLQGRKDGIHFVGGYFLTLDGNLRILHDQTPTSHFAPMLIEGLANVHFATFSAPVVTALFIAGGLIVSLSIAAGVLIFLDHHCRGSRSSRFSRVLKILTWWILGGLPLAIAASLHGGQFYPQGPVRVFVIVLSLSLIVTSIFRKSLLGQSRLAALGFLTTPLAFAMVNGRNPFPWGSAHSTVVLLFHLFFILVAAGIFWLTVVLPSAEKTAD